jgi:hypothetical protein
MNIWGDEGQEELTPREQALRDLFVSEYLVDYDPLLACIRVGFNRQYAEQYSKKFMEEPYVQRKLKELTYKVPEEEEDEESRDKRLVLTVLREAAQNGPFASRVAAASKLASILGLDKPSTNLLEVTHKGGVMQVPGVSDISDWEQAAMASQQQLIKEAQE